MLQALDPSTGATLWTYDATAAARLQLRTGKLAPNGVSLWGTPAIDPARRRIYIGTGQNLTPPTTENSDAVQALDLDSGAVLRSEEHTSELQSLMRISYAVFCLKKNIPSRT